MCSQPTRLQQSALTDLNNRYTLAVVKPLVKYSRQFSSTRIGRSCGWFTLCLFVAYLVYVPVHLATADHCLAPGLMGHVAEDGYERSPAEFAANPHHHHGEDDADHQHHSADEHDVKFTGKDGSLKISLNYLAIETVDRIPPSQLHKCQIATAEVVPHRRLASRL